MKGDLPDYITKAQLDKEAADLWKSSTLAARAILDRRAQLDRDGREDEPLVVVAGEDHSISAHQLHHMMLLKSLIAEEPSTFFCKELPHDELIRDFLKKYSFREGTSEAVDKIKQDDADGVLSIKNSMPFYSHANFLLFRFLLGQNISSAFTDASKCKPSGKASRSLDYKDSSTRESIVRCTGHPVRNLTTESPTGMYVRNDHMARQALAHASKNKVRIVVQQCGLSHVFGEVSRNNYENSLTALFKKAAVPVMAVSFEIQRYDNYLLKGRELIGNERVIIAGMPQRSLRFDYSFVTKMMDYHYDFRSHREAMAYNNAMLDRLGLGHYSTTAVERKRIEKQYNSEMGAVFKVWKKEFTPSFYDRTKAKLGL